ncbi:MAG TPA: LamG domain-containing protein [Polyangia bacterium]|nr:LamG domain-containing protein [Polyangia bacterium]
MVDAGPSCTDHVKNGDETDVDCGGSCPACATGKHCAVAFDCITTLCSAVSKVCVANACLDQVVDGVETDVDCGGGTCPTCATGKMCGGLANGVRDCMSGICSAMSHQCVATQCVDQAQDGAETDVDCGGGTCGKCGLGQVCGATTDCTSGFCNGVCVSCTPATNCASPPANTCASTTSLTTYPNPGACTPTGGCDYSATTVVPCSNGCSSGACNGTPMFLADATATSLGGTVTLDKEAGTNASTGTAPANAAVLVTITTGPSNGYQSLTLDWTNDNFTTTTKTSMTLASQSGGVDTWTASIPAQSGGTTVRFFIDGLHWDNSTHDFNPSSSVNYTYVAIALTVNLTSGIGTVTSTPAGINCATGNSGTCSFAFPPGSTVKLSTSTGFKAWGAGPCSGAPTTTPCSFTFSAATTQNVAFYAALDILSGGNAQAPDRSAQASSVSITVEGWALLTQSSVGTNQHVAFVSKGNPFAATPTGYQLGYFFDGTSFFPEFSIGIYGPQTVSCRGATAVGPSSPKVHHLAGVVDWFAATIRLYVDGTLVCTAAGPPQTDGGTGTYINFPFVPVVFGAPTGDTNPFIGSIDEVRLSNVVVYSSNFTPARHPTATGTTVGLWHFDEGTGTTATDSSGTAATATLSASNSGWTTEP